MASSSPVTNDGKHIDNIVTSTSCGKHGTPEGIPCYTMDRGFSRGGYFIGVCGTRIKKAGFVGEISADALRKSHKPGAKGGRDGKRRS